MKAFISYSHKDEEYLKRLKIHLAQIRREGKLNDWTDKDIYAGQHLNSTISRELENSQIFIALLSPDYIASGYCYDKEFEKALQMQTDGKLIIVPIICEPCDWLSTPFKEFKAIPKDGKPISEWENSNTAFVDIVFELRNIFSSEHKQPFSGINVPSNFGETISTRNYRVKKDFDSIQKMEFIDNTFKEVKELLNRYLNEIIQLSDIKFRTIKDNDAEFECLLVNRNKINVESHLSFDKSYKKGNRSSFHSDIAELTATFKSERTEESISFNLANDEYDLFWNKHDFYHTRENKVYSVKGIADSIWENWLNKVGVDLQ